MVTVEGSRVIVELNGTVILDEDIEDIVDYKDGAAHPGKMLTKGHFGFAGHRDPVAFRNIAIKELTSNPARVQYQRVDSGLVFHSSFDDVTDANLSTGDGFMFYADSTKRKLPSLERAGHDSEILKGEGLRRDALRFHSKSDRIAYYHGNEVRISKERLVRLCFVVAEVRP